MLATRERGEEARTYLINCCRSQVEALPARVKMLTPEFLAEREQARAAALFDDSPETLRLHRYASDADREMYRNVKAARSARASQLTQTSSSKEVVKTSSESPDPTSIVSRNEAISPAEPLPTAPRNEAISLTRPSKPTSAPSTSDSRNEPILNVQASTVDGSASKNVS